MENDSIIKEPKSNKLLIIIGIIIVVAILGFVGYITYNNLMKPNNNNENNIQEINQEEQQKNEDKDQNYEVVKEYDKIDDFVKNLFNYVNYDTALMEWKAKSNTTVKASDMSYSDKFKLAINYINKVYNLEKVNCDTIKEELSNHECIDSVIYKEDKVMQIMNRIFGRGNYVGKDIIEDGLQDYLYIKSIEGYILVSANKDNKRDIITNETLESVQKTKQGIILNVKATNSEGNKFDFKYKFYFNTDEDRYYFNSLEIKDSK